MKLNILTLAKRTLAIPGIGSADRERARLAQAVIDYLRAKRARCWRRDEACSPVE